MSTSSNLFQIGRERGSEDQLTEMLVWLARSVPAVCEALHGLAFDNWPTGERDVLVTTQHSIAKGRLDALLESDSAVLIVESKVGSSYGDDQIGRYLAWLTADAPQKPTRGLMTLTARPSPWPDKDKAFADAHGISRAERLWEELHGVLEPLAEDVGGLSGQLILEFLDMLSAEGLVPTQPLGQTELGTVWADSWSVVRRYRDFFHACKDRIGEALDATPAGSATWSDRGDWFWQDYKLDDGARVVVGFYCTDEDEKAPGYVPTRGPLIWMAALHKDHPSWSAVAKSLELNTPAGWYLGKRWYGERPNIWQPLAPLLTATTFDAQREAIAGAVEDGRRWVSAAVAAVVATEVSAPADDL